MKKVRRQSDLDWASPKLPFINAAEGRLHQKKQTQMQQKQTIATFLLNARRALLEGKFDAAYATGTDLLRTAVEIHGMNSTELIPSYLILGAACMGLSCIPQAEKYLSQAQWLLLKKPSCDNSVKCRVFWQLGLLYTAQRKFEKARHSLAEDMLLNKSRPYKCCKQYECQERSRQVQDYHHSS
ncbi:zinc finger MYND domain-containing protein 12-like [Corticium candelabrum]|uniref:zinc finger MYND domain-containing protein 12-like n=1 Tax=Corticium candelabrum TaxID=121492 RepID=UPI002E2696D5|nr:zinc finger MYND domain-containing protein 12-like [Corticium candelabrum]